MPNAEQYILLHELLLLHLFFSTPVLVTGAMVLWFALVRSRRTLLLPHLPAHSLVLALLGASVCSYLLALPFWLYWPFRADFLLAGFISLPALATSALAVFLFSTVAHRRWSRERHLPVHEAPSTSPPAS